LQAVGAQPVDAALRVGLDVDQPGVPQHPQVLGDRRLADAERVHERADRPLADEQQVEDPPALRLGEDGEWAGHREQICDYSYIAVKESIA